MNDALHEYAAVAVPLTSSVEDTAAAVGVKAYVLWKTNF